MPLLRVMVEAVASTRLATVLPKVEAALKETSLAKAKTKESSQAQRDKAPPAQRHPTNPPHHPTSPSPPSWPNKSLSALTTPPPPTSLLHFHPHRNPHPSALESSPSSIVPNPEIPQAITSPNTSKLVRIISAINSADETPPLPPKPIFAAMGGYLAVIEAATIAKMQLAYDQHLQRKAKGVRIVRNDPRRARTAADQSAQFTRSQHHHLTWIDNLVGMDDIGASPQAPIQRCRQSH